KEIIYFLAQLDVKEIHGYNPDLGLSVFTQAARVARPGWSATAATAAPAAQAWWQTAVSAAPAATPP
ncbi:hypothetical protein DSI82_09350, partial [Mycobacterium tuberculosis]